MPHHCGEEGGRELLSRMPRPTHQNWLNNEGSCCLNRVFSIVRIVPHFAFNLTLSNVSNGCRVTVEDSTPCKGIRIAESERFLLMESGIQLKESGIRLTIRIRNASSTGTVRNPIPGIRNPGRRIQNPRLS